MSETTDGIEYTGPGHMVTSPEQSRVYPTSAHKIDVSRTNPFLFGLYEKSYSASVTLSNDETLAEVCVSGRQRSTSAVINPGSVFV
jgi:hypothetical protein